VKHGQISYVQLPALDLAESTTFYTDVFRWAFVLDYPGSFDSPGGLIGALHTDHPVATSGGPVLWLFVDDINQTLRLISSSGGRTVAPVSVEGPRLQATFADPAGNVLGVWQENTASEPTHELREG
jgi:uncharacterized protein